MRWRRRREICGSKVVRRRWSMRSALRSTVAVAIVGLTAALGGQRARADVAATQPVALAVLNLDYVDTSGEPTDQTAAHQRRAADFVSALQRDLAANGQYRIVPMSCGSAPCEPVMNPVRTSEGGARRRREARPARRRAQNELPCSVGEDPNRRRGAGPGSFLTGC